MPTDALQRHHVSVKGSDGETVILAHGFGSDQRAWDRVAPHFERTRRVVRFDLSGCGQPEPAAYDFDRHASLSGYADDLLEIHDALGVREVIYVGHSVSGIIGVLAANRRPEAFDKLVLLGATPRYLDDPPDYVGGFNQADIAKLLGMMDRNFVSFARMFAAVAMHDDAHPDFSEGLAQTMCSGDPEITRRFARVLFMSDHRSDIEALRLPTLLLHCESDSIAPPCVGQFMHERIPDSTLSIIPGSGHCPHLTHPEETVSRVQAFLETAPRPTP